MQLLGISLTSGSQLYHLQKVLQDNCTARPCDEACFHFFVCIQNAIKKKVKSCGSGEKKEHWMDYAKDDYGVSYIIRGQEH